MEGDPHLTVEDYAYSRLLSYVRYQWAGYRIGAHHAVIAAHLEAVERGALKRLIITLPPRHGKTMLVSEFFPAWYLGRNPSHQIIFATYSHDRASDVGKKVRNQIAEPLFSRIFPEAVIAKDSQSVSNVGTAAGGNFFAVGAGGGIMGRGAHLFLMDDLIKSQEEADSRISRDKMREWYRSTAYTRLMPQDAIVLIMTRWRDDDLAGWLLDEHADEGWVHVNLPALCEEEGPDILGRMKGEALWPEAYPLERLHKIKAAVGTRVWNALYQQNPVGAEGGMIKMDWFRYYDETPEKFLRVVQSWDTAFKAAQLNDPSACVTFGETRTESYVLDVFVRRMEYPELRKQASIQFDKWNPSVVLCEDKGSGQSLIQDLRRNTRIPVVAVNPESDKMTRMSSQSGYIEAGRFLLPRYAPWLVDYETELVRFPYGKHDDCVDATSQYLKYLKKPKYKPSRVRFWK